MAASIIDPLPFDFSTSSSPESLSNFDTESSYKISSLSPISSESNGATILIVSYGSGPNPIFPPVDLEYDIRTTPTPPRNICHLHTGLSEDLQDAFRQKKAFSDNLGRAESEIRDAMQERKLRGQVMVLRVGCLCVSGHHRSVAFAEILAKTKWPTNWRVEVQHRNLTQADKDRKEKLRQEAEEAKSEVGTD